MRGMKRLALLGVPGARGGAGESGEFSPTDIAGLVAWYDASDLTTLFQDSAKTTAVTSNDDPVGCWADKSATGADVTAEEGARPLYKTATGGVYFTTDDVLTTTAAGLVGINGNEAVTVFSVMSRENVSHQVSWGNTSHTNPSRGLISTGQQTRAYKRSQTGTVAQPGFDLDYSATIYLFSLTDTGAVGNMWLDGVQKLTDQSTDVGSVTFDIFGLGAQTRSSPTAFLTGTICEVVIYTGVLSAANRQAVEAYLAPKWGISLP